MSRVIIFCLLSVSMMMTGCGIEELMDRRAQIQEVLDANCDCDEISNLGFTISTGEQTATYKLVGCEFDSILDEKERLYRVLKEEIEFLCEMDRLELRLVNKGKIVSVRIEDCVLKEN